LTISFLKVIVVCYKGKDYLKGDYTNNLEYTIALSRLLEEQ